MVGVTRPRTPSLHFPALVGAARAHARGIPVAVTAQPYCSEDVMRHADEPKLTDEDKRAIEAIRLELDREFGPPWPDAAPPAGSELAPPPRSSIAAASGARPSRGLRLALGAGITTLAAAVVAAVVSLVDVSALISPPRSAVVFRSTSAPRPAPPLSEPDPSPITASAAPSRSNVEQGSGEPPRLTHRPRPVSRDGRDGDAGRSTGAPAYRRPVGSQPSRDGGTLTTRYRTERPAAKSVEPAGFVQAP